MSKELPYFKFYVNEWITGDISLEDYEVQGLFANLCAYYWSKECNITLVNAKRKFKDCKPTAFDSLISAKIIKVDSKDNLTINFLLEQLESRAGVSKTNSNNGKKGGRPKGSVIANTETPEKKLHQVSPHHFENTKKMYALPYEAQEQGFRDMYNAKEYSAFVKFLSAMLKEFQSELEAKFDRCLSIGDWKKYLKCSGYMVVKPFIIKVIGATDGDRKNMAARIATYSNGAFDEKIFAR